MNRRLSRFFGAGALALAIAACNSDGSTGANDRLTLEESADAAATVGDAVGEDVGQWMEGEGMLGGGTVDFTATVTFNGTRIVPLDVGEREFCLDLALRRLSSLTCR
jgi:hypothetical protein